MGRLLTISDLFGSLNISGKCRNRALVSGLLQWSGKETKTHLEDLDP